MKDNWGKVEPWASEKSKVILGLIKTMGGGDLPNTIGAQLALSMIEDLKQALADMTAQRDGWHRGYDKVIAEAKDVPGGVKE